MVKFKLVSSLEKAFLDDNIDMFTSLTKLSALRGETISLQILATYEPDGQNLLAIGCDIALSGMLAQYANVRFVRHMPVNKPNDYGYGQLTEGYLKTTPGLYPDLLEPFRFNNKLVLQRFALESVWIDITIPDSDSVVGISTLDIHIKSRDRDDRRKPIVLQEDALSCEIEVINAALPEQTLKMTQWFYCDTLAEYYNIPVWSEEHWEIIENFARCAVKHGQNMLLTPIITPTLDTYVGGERLTNQLVKITKTDTGYTFDFSLLDRWIDMCDRVGIKYLEIAHLFTQWGATHAPKVVMTVDGEEKTVFGWDTDAHSEEYGQFLRTLLTQMLAHLKARGDDRRCYFHISDEPHENELEDYQKSQDQVKAVLEGYTIMDALSSFEFYKNGVTKTPIPNTRNAHTFIDGGVEDLWVYYCGGAGVGCSARMLAMPAARNRALGMQLYKYNIVGFLHWGFNFYNTSLSYSKLNPFADLSGENWVPAGDTFMVYPGADRMPMESTRLYVFNEGLTDMRAMQLCEKYYSHEEVVKAIDEAAGIDVRFTNTVCDAATVLKIRETINQMIKAKLSEK